MSHCVKAVDGLSFPYTTLGAALESPYVYMFHKPETRARKINFYVNDITPFTSTFLNRLMDVNFKMVAFFSLCFIPYESVYNHNGTIA